MKIKVYPYSKMKFSTSLTMDEIEARLESRVEKVNNPMYDVYAPNDNTNLFGLIESDSFEIYRTRFFSSRPVTIVSGTVVRDPRSQQNEVELIYTLNFFTLLFSLLCLGFLLIVICMIIIN